MKLFLIVLALFAVSSVRSVEPLSSEQELESIADFLEKVKKIVAQLKEKGSDFVCSAKLPQLLDILGLPDQLDGAVALAQKLICGESALVKRSSDVEGLESINDFLDKVKKIAAELKKRGSEFVCSAKLQELLEILGLPDALSGAVKLAQDLICGNAALVKRELDVSPEMHVQLVGAFKDTVKAIYERLKTYVKGMVCSSRLQKLLHLLGLPNDLDGAVQLAQEWLCKGKPVDSNALMVVNSSALEGFVDWFKELVTRLKAYGTDLVCTAKLQELLEILGLPDALSGAVKMAQDLICGNAALVKRELDITPEMHVQLVGAFKDTVKAIYEKLKTYVKGVVCSSRLQKLLHLLGLSNDLDGAVQLAQEWLCKGKPVSSTALMAVDPAALQGFYDTVKEIFQQLVALGETYVCSAVITELVALLGLPDTLMYAVKVAVGWFCN